MLITLHKIISSGIALYLTIAPGNGTRYPISKYILIPNNSIINITGWNSLTFQNSCLLTIDAIMITQKITTSADAIIRKNPFASHGSGLIKVLPAAWGKTSR